MRSQDEVTWLLETIKDEWPDSSFPDNLRRINRDEPEVLETGERTNAVDLQRYTAVGVSTGSTQRTFRGTGPRYRIEKTLDVRVRGQTASNWGEEQDVLDAEEIVEYVQRAISTQTTYPRVYTSGYGVSYGESYGTLDSGYGYNYGTDYGGADVVDDDIGKVCYVDLKIQDQTELSPGDRDIYGTEFSVRLRGNTPRLG